MCASLPFFQYQKSSYGMTDKPLPGWTLATAKSQHAQSVFRIFCQRLKRWISCLFCAFFHAHIGQGKRIKTTLFWIANAKIWKWAYWLRLSVNGLIQIPILHPWSRQRAPMFESRRRRGEFGCEPDGKGSKIAGFEYSLDFLVLFHQGKRTVQHDVMTGRRTASSTKPVKFWCVCPAYSGDSENEKR